MEKMDTSDKVYLILFAALILGLMANATFRGKIS